LFPLLKIVFLSSKKKVVGLGGSYDASPIPIISGSVAQLLVLKIIHRLDGLILSGDL
jgi:hypothetical protein